MPENNQTGAPSSDARKKKLKKQAKREARAMQAVEEARRDFQKAQQRLAKATRAVQEQQEMLQAAVHSMYRRLGSAGTFRSRTGAAASGASGSFKGQSPQNVDPPALRSLRSPLAAGPVQIAVSGVVRKSPSTRLPYGSAQPHTIRPSQSITAIDQGQLQVNRVAR